MTPVQVIPLICVTLAAAQNLVSTEEGDECLAATVEHEAWFCKLINNCPAAEKLFKQHKIPPKHLQCGFKGRDGLVCCPPYEISDWNNITSTLQLPNALSFGFSATSDSAAPALAPGEKSAAKCEEYRIWQEQSYLVQSGSFQAKRCNHFEQVNTNYVAEPKGFPHMALLGYGSPPSYKCGATLISEKFVLSAAHCERNPGVGPVTKVLLGELDLSLETDDAKPESYNVSRIIVHPDYKPESNYHDIMLVELEKAVRFSQYVRPVCLHNSRNIAQFSGIATGWGRIEHEGKYSPRLQKIKLPFVSHKACNDSFREHAGSKVLKFGIVDETQLCAGGEKGKDMCQSGGPIQISLGDCMPCQVGISSFGRKCGTHGSPGVYTRVSAYVPWIEKVVWP